MVIPGINLIATFLAGAVVSIVGVWLWLGSGSVRLRAPGQLSLHRRLLFISATSLLSGLLILAVAEWAKDSPWEKTLRDIGGAFLAAAIIGYIVELAEIRDFFKTLLAELVTGMDFLRTLSSEDLLRHGQLSLNELVGRTVRNPEYANSLVQPILDATLPHLQSVYRENFNAVMKVHVISSKERLAAILKDVWEKDTSIAGLSAPVFMVEVVYSYTLLRPAEKQKPFKGTLWVESRVIEDLQLDLHARCVIKIDDVSKSLPLTPSKKGLLHQFSGDYEVPLGEPRVTVEVRTWQLDSSRSTFTMQMISLTKGLTLTFSCKDDVYPSLDLFGLHGEKSNVRSDDPNVVTFANPDFIMLPGHGFSVSWSPEALTTPRNARLSPSVLAGPPPGGAAPASLIAQAGGSGASR